MRNRPNARSPRTRRSLTVIAGLVLAGQLATGSPGHAADLPLTSERLTVHVVGNPP